MTPRAANAGAVSHDGVIVMTDLIVVPPEDSNNLKRCSKCHEWKPRDAFSRNRTLGDGLQRRCKACNAAYYVANHERVAAYREANRERLQQYYAEYYSAHHEEELKRSRKYDATHREARRKSTSGWQKANPEKHRDKQQRRRARKSGASGTYTTADIEAIRKAQGNRCYLCGKSLKSGYHVDHFIPLSKGGTNDPGNLRLACPKCNLSKGSKHPAELGRLL